MAIDAASGKLTVAGSASTGGSFPRHFGIDPGGSYLIAANQKGNSLVMLKIDPRSGQLAATGKQVEVPAPVCVVFVATK
jgi:6-phosphogluconolactonase